MENAAPDAAPDLKARFSCVGITGNPAAAAHPAFRPVGDCRRARSANLLQSQSQYATTLAMELLVFLFLVGLFFLVRSHLSVDRPRALQHMFEGVEGFIQSQSHEIIGR